jgi:hypothetical protein
MALTGWCESQCTHVNRAHKLFTILGNQTVVEGVMKKWSNEKKAFYCINHKIFFLSPRKILDFLIFFFFKVDYRKTLH